jgi:2-isopropylmalate synthase
MFVTEDTTRSRPEILKALYTKALDAGAERLCIADTVGAADQRGTARVVTFLRNLIRENGFEGVAVDWHGHRDRGLGLANALAALDAGADRIHGAGLGTGERVGNTPLDLLIVNLKLKGWWKPDVRKLTEYVDWISVNLNVPIPDDYPVFGKNAFRTQSGVHASAILKAVEHGEPALAESVYSAIDATWFGFEQVIDVGPMSGGSNVRHWLMKHGIEETPGLVEVILNEAKASPRTLSDLEIMRLIREREGAS